MAEDPNARDEDRGRLLDALNDEDTWTAPPRRPQTRSLGSPSSLPREQISQTDHGLLLEVYDLVRKLVAANDASGTDGADRQYERLSSALLLFGRRVDARLGTFEERLDGIQAHPDAFPGDLLRTLAREQAQLRDDVTAMKDAIEQLRRGVLGL
ncbi:MAG: hypothetical protein QOI95_318 [Acidimicrobiaceae bacterium]